LDAQGVITRAADSPVSLGIGGTFGRQSIDPLTGNLLVFDTPSSSVYSYNPVTNVWLKHGSHPLNDAYGAQISVFTPVSEYGVVFVVKWNGASSKVYLYKHKASN
jgi:hypothetical protein